MPQNHLSLLSLVSERSKLSNSPNIYMILVSGWLSWMVQCSTFFIFLPCKVRSACMKSFRTFPLICSRCGSSQHCSHPVSPHYCSVISRNCRSASQLNSQDSHCITGVVSLVRFSSFRSAGGFVCFYFSFGRRSAWTLQLN